MAYKQKPFSGHYSTSPAQEWDWYEDNVADRGYLGSAATGASIGAQVGSIVPGVGNVVGGVVGGIIGLGANYVQQDDSIFNQDKDYNSGVNSMTEYITGYSNDAYGQQMKRQEELMQESIEERKAHTREVKEKLRERRRLASSIESASENKNIIDPERVGTNLYKLQKIKKGQLTNVKPVDTGMGQNWNEYKAKTSPAAQLAGRASRPEASNNLTPIASPFSTNQTALNGQDETNLAVQYARFNSIAQDLSPMQKYKNK